MNRGLGRSAHPAPIACKEFFPALHCARHCMGSDKQLKPSSFGSHPFNGDVPIHGEPSLEGFSFPVTVLRTIVGAASGAARKETATR